LVNKTGKEAYDAAKRDSRRIFQYSDEEKEGMKAHTKVLFYAVKNCDGKGSDGMELHRDTFWNMTTVDLMKLSTTPKLNISVSVKDVNDGPEEDANETEF
jgi:hypothetical protein